MYTTWKSKMVAVAVLDFGKMSITPSDTVVFVFCAKFGSNICYSHWDRRTYPSDFHVMTSRELTSGFDFWSRGHLCMAVMHLPVKLRKCHAKQPNTVTRPNHVITERERQVTAASWSLERLQLAWKSYSRPQNLSFWGVLPPKFRGTSFRPPKRHILAWLHVFWAIACKNPSTGLTFARAWEKRYK